MSIFEGVKIAGITEFNGIKPLLDSVDVTPGDALVSLNCKFSPGQCGMREGFAPAWTGSTSVVGTYFLSPHYYGYGSVNGGQSDYLAWLDTDFGPTNLFLKARNLNTNTTYTIKTLVGASLARTASFASQGARLYGSAERGGYVWDGDTSHTMNDCFQRPMKTTEVTLGLTQPAGGVCTAGTHYVGVLFETRDGYWTRPGPVDSALVLQPQSIVSTGANNVLVTLTPATTWPAWIKAVQVIYTTSLNNFQYYIVPSTITSITAGSATVYTISVSVADIQLKAVGSQGAGTLADPYFSLLSMDASDAAPFSVKFQLSWGDRIVWFTNYGGTDSFFPSNPLNPEWITADQHLKQLPDGKPIGAAFVLGGVLYVISSAGGVFGYSDNGGLPVNFQPPRTVDSRISCSKQSSVTVAASGGSAFVLADQGLFVYSGTTFPLTAMNYYQQADMKSAGADIVIKDFTQEQVVLVQGRSSTTGAPCLYALNYQNGTTPDKVRATKWTGSSVLAGSGQSELEIVRNPTKNAWEVWAGYLNGGMLRRKSALTLDVALYTDYTNTTTGVFGIDWQYQTSLLPPTSNGEIWNHIAGRLRAKSTQATVAVSSISTAAAAVVTTSAVHGLAVGTTLTVTISGATGTGWSAINATFTPTILTQTTFSVPVVSTGFGVLGGTVIVTINGNVPVVAKNLDDTISVTPAVSPIAISSAPGRLYDFPYDLQSEAASYLFTNGALAGNGVLISEVKHAYNLFATER